ncbi:hypothetical protein L596_014470 [Steinernema carpocapsae]|uniref:Uncharacterized protein n=1 Tax=Steinernema carpocapsae TaxID=34508 RepID=A0A4U5NCU9_STECR|nr:hypothetical protein L596_014470 [Steinernema carpocapsae]
MRTCAVEEPRALPYLRFNTFWRYKVLPIPVGRLSKEGGGFGFGFFHVRAIAISLGVGLSGEFLSFTSVRLESLGCG